MIFGCINNNRFIKYYNTVLVRIHNGFFTISKIDRVRVSNCLIDRSSFIHPSITLFSQEILYFVLLHLLHSSQVEVTYVAGKMFF